MEDNDINKRLKQTKKKWSFIIIILNSYSYLAIIFIEEKILAIFKCIIYKLTLF